MGKQNRYNPITVILIVVTMLFCLLLPGCSSSAAPGSALPAKASDLAGASGQKAMPPRDNTPKVRKPEASGAVTYTNSEQTATIDASHTAEGYVMIRYTGTVQKIRLQITPPDGNTYSYLVSESGNFETFPLSGGNGSYQIEVLENIPDAPKKNTYATILTQGIDVAIADEFSPFLYPNQYVNFEADSEAVATGADLAEACYSDLDVVGNIYNYVIDSISYDEELAENVSWGYLPDVDYTLSSGEGICFDYAALMSAMLRSQNIPTKLVVGYSGDVYHAWISTYVDDIGWIDNVIEFDGKSWSLMDPTLAANNTKQNVKKYISDGSHYTVKYSY